MAWASVVVVASCDRFHYVRKVSIWIITNYGTITRIITASARHLQKFSIHLTNFYVSDLNYYVTNQHTIHIIIKD